MKRDLLGIGEVMRRAIAALVLGTATLMACASSSDEADTSGGSALSGGGSASDGSDAPITLAGWRSNPRIVPLLAVALDIAKTGGAQQFDQRSVVCDDPAGLESGLQNSDRQTHAVRELMETSFNQTDAGLESTDKFSYYDTAGKLVLLQIVRFVDPSHKSAQYVFVENDKAIFQFVSATTISFAAESPPDSTLVLASDPAAQTKFGVSEYQLTSGDLTTVHPQFSDDGFRAQHKCHDQS
jgi:hypothetical protein